MAAQRFGQNKKSTVNLDQRKLALGTVFHRQIVRKKCENVSIAQNAALSGTVSYEYKSLYQLSLLEGTLYLPFFCSRPR